MAEREGFEPSIRFLAYTRSRRAPSTTRPPLPLKLKKIIYNFYMTIKIKMQIYLILLGSVLILLNIWLDNLSLGKIWYY